MNKFTNLAHILSLTEYGRVIIIELNAHLKTVQNMLVGFDPKKERTKKAFKLFFIHLPCNFEEMCRVLLLSC